MSDDEATRKLRLRQAMMLKHVYDPERRKTRAIEQLAAELRRQRERSATNQGNAKAPRRARLPTRAKLETMLKGLDATKRAEKIKAIAKQYSVERNSVYQRLRRRVT